MKMQLRRTLQSVAVVAALVAGWLLLPPAQRSQAADAQASLRPTTLALDSGTKTATAVAGAVTLNKSSGVITTEALTTIAGATYTLTITNSTIQATDLPYASVWLGTSTTGTPTIATVKPQAGSLVIIVQNIHASAVFNGTLKIAFFALEN